MLSIFLTGQSTGKRPLGKPKRRWEVIKEISVNARNLIDSVNIDYWRVLLNAALILRVPEAM